MARARHQNRKRITYRATKPGSLKFAYFIDDKGEEFGTKGEAEAEIDRQERMQQEVNCELLPDHGPEQTQRTHVPL